MNISEICVYIINSTDDKVYWNIHRYIIYQYDIWNLEKCHCLMTETLLVMFSDFNIFKYNHPNSPDSKVHGVNMGPTWVLSAPDGPHVGPMNLAMRVYTTHTCTLLTTDEDIYCVLDINWRFLMGSYIVIYYVCSRADISWSLLCLYTCIVKSGISVGRLYCKKFTTSPSTPTPWLLRKQMETTAPASQSISVLLQKDSHKAPYSDHPSHTKQFLTQQGEVKTKA